MAKFYLWVLIIAIAERSTVTRMVRCLCSRESKFYMSLSAWVLYLGDLCSISVPIYIAISILVSLEPTSRFFPDVHCHYAGQESKSVITNWISASLIRNAAKDRFAKPTRRLRDEMSSETSPLTRHFISNWSIALALYAIFSTFLRCIKLLSLLSNCSNNS